jgi:hypothetical protein
MSLFGGMSLRPKDFLNVSSLVTFNFRITFFCSWDDHTSSGNTENDKKMVKDGGAYDEGCQRATWDVEEG